jgi:hypothetical protein
MRADLCVPAHGACLACRRQALHAQTLFSHPPPQTPWNTTTPHPSSGASARRRDSPLASDDNAPTWRSGIAPDTADTDDVDKTGNNWMAITDPVLLKCTNLDGLIKKRGDVVEEEKARWAAMGCEEKLKDLYTLWQRHSEATKGNCEELREEANIEVGVDWGFATSSVKRKWKEMLCDCHYTAGWSDS